MMVGLFHLFDDLFDRICIGLYKLYISVFQDIERTLLCYALFYYQFIYLMCNQKLSNLKPLPFHECDKWIFYL